MLVAGQCLCERRLGQSTDLTRRPEHFLPQLRGTIGSVQRTEKKMAIVTKLKVKSVIHLYREIIVGTRRATPCPQETMQHIYLLTAGVYYQVDSNSTDLVL
jgi:hypothetical protein